MNKGIFSKFFTCESGKSLKAHFGQFWALSFLASFSLRQKGSSGVPLFAFGQQLSCLPKA
jgi:hypothetical protein